MTRQRLTLNKKNTKKQPRKNAAPVKQQQKPITDSLLSVYKRTLEKKSKKTMEIKQYNDSSEISNDLGELLQKKLVEAEDEFESYLSDCTIDNNYNYIPISFNRLIESVFEKLDFISLSKTVIDNYEKERKINREYFCDVTRALDMIYNCIEKTCSSEKEEPFNTWKSKYVFFKRVIWSVYNDPDWGKTRWINILSNYIEYIYFLNKCLL